MVGYVDRAAAVAAVGAGRLGSVARLIRRTLVGPAVAATVPTVEEMQPHLEA